MEIRVLNYFLIVAREENITRAAQLLHVTQPTISRQLMQLEEELGVKLFLRSNHNIILTEEGRLLRRRAQEIIDLSDKTKQELLQTRDEISGEISIGGGELLSINCFSDIMHAFQRENPLVTYNMFSGIVDTVKERIENGLLDFGILIEPVDISKYEFVQLPQKERWGVLVRNDSPLAKLEKVTPSDLIGTPLIMPGSEEHHKAWLTWFGDDNDNINIISSYSLLYNAAVMVQKGMGAVICIELNANYDNLVFIPVEPKRESGSVFVWKKRQALSPAVSAFISFAKTYLQSIS